VCWKNRPELRVGFEIRMVQAVRSQTWSRPRPRRPPRGSPMPRRRSAGRSSEWTPASASGRSFELKCAQTRSCRFRLRLVDDALGLEVEQVADRLGQLARSHDFTSANSASNSWPCVGAVSTVFCGNRVTMCQMTSQAQNADLPTPWPARTVRRRPPGPRGSHGVGLPGVGRHADDVDGELDRLASCTPR
jgi:hypothetical protein